MSNQSLPENVLSVKMDEVLYHHVLDDEYTNSDIEYLFSFISNNDHYFWNKLLSKIINHYGLSTLRFLSVDCLDKKEIEILKEIILFLKNKVNLKINLIGEQIKCNRDEILNFLKKSSAPEQLVFTISCLDRESLQRFYSIYFTV